MAASVNSNWPARAPRGPQAAEPQDTLEVSEQHLDALAVSARLLEGLDLGERTRHVAGFLLYAAQDLASWLLGKASRLECAHGAIGHAGSRRASHRS